MKIPIRQRNQADSTSTQIEWEIEKDSAAPITIQRRWIGDAAAAGTCTPTCSNGMYASADTSMRNQRGAIMSVSSTISTTAQIGDPLAEVPAGKIEIRSAFSPSKKTAKNGKVVGPERPGVLNISRSAVAKHGHPHVVLQHRGRCAAEGERAAGSARTSLYQGCVWLPKTQDSSFKTQSIAVLNISACPFRRVSHDGNGRPLATRPG